MEKISNAVDDEDNGRDDPHQRLVLQEALNEGCDEYKRLHVDCKPDPYHYPPTIHKKNFVIEPGEEQKHPNDVTQARNNYQCADDMNWSGRISYPAKVDQ